MDVPRQNRGRSRRRRLAWGAGLTLGLILLWFGVSRLQPAARPVDAATLLIGTVERGDLLRQVRGPGILVPEEARWIAALTEAWVDRIVLRPGAPVEPDSLILELSNPAVEREARDAEWRLEAARADTADLRARLEGEILRQEAELAAVEAEAREAALGHDANMRLADEGLLPEIELQRSEIRAGQLVERVEIERRRREQLRGSVEAQLGAQEARLGQARALWDLRRGERDALLVRAGLSGVVQEVPVEEGQRIAPGTNLARVARPERLKAELRVAEVQAKDVEVGQAVEVDTRNGIVEGRVARVDPAAHEGTVTVEVALPAELPDGARPWQSVDGTIQIEKVEGVLWIGRPAFAQPGSTVGLYRLEPDGDEARRVPVRLGKTSVSQVEVLEGLAEGDQVILSDTAQFGSHDRLRLKGN